MRSRLAPFVLLAVARVAVASSGFYVTSSSAPGTAGTYAISTGWYYPVQQAALVNARDLHRTGDLLGSPGIAPEWTSRFGSVALTMIGDGFPMSGVNEKGLVIQATVLKDHKFPAAPAGAQGLSSLQWIQYHLDTSASVDEVLQKSVVGPSPVLPQGSIALMFQVCDARDCAVFAFFEDTALAHGSVGRYEVNLRTGEKKIDKANRAPAAITNHLMPEALAALAKCPNADCDKPGDSLMRFVRMANAASSFKAKPPTAAELVQRVFTDLKTVDQGFPLTTWNEAYVLQRAPTGGIGAKVYFKAPERPLEDLQWVDFSRPDYDCRSPRKVWWLSPSRGGGDRTAEATDFGPSAQERLAEQHRKENGGAFPAALVSAFVAYPQTHARCAAGSVAKRQPSKP